MNLVRIAPAAAIFSLALALAPAPAEAAIKIRGWFGGAKASQEKAPDAALSCAAFGGGAEEAAADPGRLDRGGRLFNGAWNTIAATGNFLSGVGGMAIAMRTGDFRMMESLLGSGETVSLADFPKFATMILQGAQGFACTSAACSVAFVRTGLAEIVPAASRIREFEGSIDGVRDGLIRPFIEHMRALRRVGDDESVETAQAAARFAVFVVEAYFKANSGIGGVGAEIAKILVRNYLHRAFVTLVNGPGSMSERLSALRTLEIDPEIYQRIVVEAGLVELLDAFTPAQQAAAASAAESNGSPR